MLRDLVQGKGMLREARKVKRQPRTAGRAGLSGVSRRSLGRSVGGPLGGGARSKDLREGLRWQCAITSDPVRLMQAVAENDAARKKTKNNRCCNRGPLSSFRATLGD